MDMERQRNLVRGRMILAGLTAKQAVEVKLEGLSADELMDYYKRGSLPHDGIGPLTCRVCGTQAKAASVTAIEVSEGGDELSIKVKCVDCSWLWSLRVATHDLEDDEDRDDYRMPTVR